MGDGEAPWIADADADACADAMADQMLGAIDDAFADLNDDEEILRAVREMAVSGTEEQKKEARALIAQRACPRRDPWATDPKTDATMRILPVQGADLARGAEGATDSRGSGVAPAGAAPATPAGESGSAAEGAPSQPPAPAQQGEIGTVSFSEKVMGTTFLFYVLALRGSYFMWVGPASEPPKLGSLTAAIGMDMGRGRVGARPSMSSLLGNTSEASESMSRMLAARLRCPVFLSTSALPEDAETVAYVQQRLVRAAVDGRAPVAAGGASE